MSEPLTSLEQQVYLFILDYLAKHTYQPSVRDIAARFGIKSTKSVSALLISLEKKGYVEREDARSRGLRLVGMSAAVHMMPVPHYSRLATDHPALRDENRSGFLAFDRTFAPDPETFAITADDVTASPAHGVLSGDLLVVNPSAPAATGSLVLARVNRRVFVRAVEHRGSHIVLIGQDASVRELVLDAAADFEILGVVTGIFRGLKAPHS